MSLSWLPLQSRRPRFQIVASLGPACSGKHRELAAAGATSFRLNASHLSPAGLRAEVERVRQELPAAPLVIDLQGAKMRLGRFLDRPVLPGQRLSFALLPDRDEQLPLPHRELFESVQPGETLSCDDDRLRFRIERVAPAELEATALGAGTLQPRKGVNLIEHPVRLGGLTAIDRAQLEALGDQPDLALAFSFMLDGSETGWLREQRPAAVVVGKIERAEAVASLASIQAAVDAIWICRGDLGAQLGPAALARWVGALEPAGLSCPVLMAGQVLEHLTRNPEPTRSELCHLHDLIARGYAGLVLSDETAIGHDPVGAVRWAAALAAELLG